MADIGLFVFAEDGVGFFPTVEKAAGYVEAIDVENGVYEAFFTLEGERLRAHGVDETNVRLERSGVADMESLRALLRRERDIRGGFTSNPDDPVAVANELLSLEWSGRWPKWPRWLDARLHGTEPPRA